MNSLVLSNNHALTLSSGNTVVLFDYFVPKNADMAVADLTITEHRETVVDFTVPYMYYTEEIAEEDIFRWKS